jgi:diguanylate cyclase (GGDEF)-like protein
LLLYKSGTPSPSGPSRTQSFAFGDRIWEITLRYQQGHAPVFIWPMATFLTLAMMSGLLGLLVFTVLGTRRKALLLAQDMTSKYRLSEDRFRLLNENLPGLVLLADEHGVISYANRSCRERLDLDVGQGATVMQAFSLPSLLDKLSALPSEETSLRLPRVRLWDRSKAVFWASLSFTRMSIDGTPHILVLGSDISEVISMSEKLQFQATHDYLTGLCNRRHFEHHMALSIAAQNAGGPTPALLYIDLDQFKVINDTAGHMAGDGLLVKAADGLRGLLAGSELLARLGGDEFGVLVPDASPESAKELAEAVRKFFDDFFFEWDSIRYHVTCSIGIAMLSQCDLTKENFLSCADAACYMAKELGRNRWQFFDASSPLDHRRLEMLWVGRIRQAMADNRLKLHYQDIVPIGPSSTNGSHFELLIRMEDEHGHIVPAFEFIPAAERYGLMPLIDRWVVDTALGNFAHLHPSGNIATCAINLSGDTVDDPDFEAFLLDALIRHTVPAEKVCFEITETAAIRNMPRLLQFIPALRATCCRLSLDDFGAGMSSFTYLKNLKVDVVKIDGSFIRDLEQDVMSQSIVSAVIEIAHKMKMEVVAEWVDSQSALEMLGRMGVDYAQGFFLHKPTRCPIPNPRKHS